MPEAPHMVDVWWRVIVCSLLPQKLLNICEKNNSFRVILFYIVIQHAALFLSINAFSSIKKIAVIRKDNIFYLQELVQGFDQETAAVVMARLASLKMETEVYLKMCYFLLFSIVSFNTFCHCWIYLLKWLNFFSLLNWAILGSFVKTWLG